MRNDTNQSCRFGRWLLKICYNSARASHHSDAQILSQFAGDILGVHARQPDVAIWLDLLEPSYFEFVRDDGLIEVERILPAMTRVCHIQIPGAEIRNYSVRLVAINAFYFYVAFPKAPYSGVFDDLVRIVECFSLMACLDAETSVVRAKTTGLSTQQLIGPHIDENRELYDAHYKREAESRK